MVQCSVFGVSSECKIEPETETENENDFVYLDKISSEDLIKFDLGYTDLGYVTFCNNCNGCNTGIKIPVTPKKQGLRI